MKCLFRALLVCAIFGQAGMVLSATIILPDLTTGGTASGGPGGTGGGEGPDQAFDNNSGSKILVFTNPTPLVPIFIQYDFAGTTAFTVQSYSLTSANDSPDRDPADIRLQGTNDPDSTTPTYVTIDTRTGIDFVDDSQGNVDADTSDRFETLFFTVPLGNQASYQAYRLLIDESANPSNDRPQLAELQLFDTVVVPEPSTVALLGIGLIGMAGYAARRRR